VGTPQFSPPQVFLLIIFVMCDRIFFSCEDFEKWFNKPFNKMSGSDKNELLNEEETLLIIHR
jgi:ATP-dependent helicase STH1/SNF2